MKKTFTLLAGLGFGLASFAQAPFPAMNVNFYDSTQFPTDIETVMIPESPLKYDVLFVGGVDMVHNANGQSAIAKEWQDFTGYVPIDGRSDSGYVVVNHERLNADAVNGDGGGMTVFTVKKNTANGEWEVVTPANGRKFRSVDFSNVGGTAANCGGIQTKWGQVFTAEEWGVFFSNDAIMHPDSYGLGFAYDPAMGGGISDTSDWTINQFNGTTINRTIPRHENYQFMVEVDVANAVAVRKNYNMGRFDHEGGWVADDEKTVYLSDDKSSGSVLFKFVANTARDFSAGQLYAYKQSNDGESGSWLTIPMDFDSLMYARDVALHMGASIFMRLEWVDGKGEMVYITETGRGKNFDVSGAMAKGGTLAKHLADLDTDNDGVASDVFGRVLRLDASTNKLEVMLEGGGTLDANNIPTGNHLTSPDGLTLAEVKGKTVLMIQEDLNPSGAPASPDQFSGKLCEIYMLDISGDAAGTTYNVSDLVRFAAGPKGCEVTGGRFTPDGSTFFFNVQHPDANNAYPFNHSVTIAVTGFEDYISSISDVNNNTDQLTVWPNPVSQQLNLNQVTDVRLFEMGSGKLVRVARNTNRVNVEGLNAGVYIMQTINGDIKKVIIE